MSGQVKSRRYLHNDWFFLIWHKLEVRTEFTISVSCSLDYAISGCSVIRIGLTIQCLLACSHPIDKYGPVQV